MKIEIGKKYTSNGKNLRVVGIDREYILGNKVIGVFDDGTTRCFRANGESSFDSKYDLQEVWEPQPNEWCLFWHREESGNAILDKFIGISESGLFKACSRASWQYCVKFTGELPEHLKGL
jgi:hypothetical protein